MASNPAQRPDLPRFREQHDDGLQSRAAQRLGDDRVTWAVAQLNHPARM
jgi:hypothetical protein